MVRTTSFALTALLVVAACESEDEKQAELIKGAWDCSMRDTIDGAAVEMYAADTYRSNKTSTTAGNMTMSMDGVEIYMEFVADGTWDIESGSLFLSVDNFALTGARAAGMTVDPATLRAMESELAPLLDVESSARITRLTEDRLEYSSPNSGDVSCRRF